MKPGAPLFIASALLAGTFHPFVFAGDPVAPLSAAFDSGPARKNAAHVVLMVCDGLRPDFVTEKNMPTLYKLSREGVTFAHNHCVYPSSTEVNGTALATGVFPAVSGITGNKEYRPGTNPRRAIPTESREAIRGGDKATDGKYLAVATIAEMVQAAGYPTVIAGTKGVALLHDRAEVRSSQAAKQSWVTVGGKNLSTEVETVLTQALGAFPAVSYPNAAEDEWTTQALIQNAWKTGVPKFSLLWVSDPDFSQHATAPGSETALAALRSCDNKLAAVLAALDAKGARADTDVFIVSDHGFSTLVSPPDVISELVNGGLPAVPDFAASPAKPGQILVVNLGGSVAFYVINHDSAATGKLVEFLQKSSFAGPIFTREKIEGTFSLDRVRANSENAPDVLMAFRWSDIPNQFGTPGLILGGPGKNNGRGMHASLSKYDLHNTLIAAGPDLKHGYVDELPTGNTDVAPTILSILGIHPAQAQQGRVLCEALAGKTTEGTALSKSHQTTIRASRKLGGVVWNQYLTISTLGEAVYIEEGNTAPEK